MTAEERSKKFIEELDEVERMTPKQLRDGLQKLSQEDGFAGLVARAVLANVGDVH